MIPTHDELLALKEWIDHEFRGRTIHAEHPITKLYELLDLHLDGRYVMVPREPTQDMIDDAEAMDCLPVIKIIRAYRAMIAAHTATEQGE